MAEIVSTIATTIFDHSVGVIGRQFGYLWNYKHNMVNLKTLVQKLDAERNDKSHSVSVAQKNAERIRNGVLRWQEEAKEISEETKQIIEEYEEKRKKKCFMGLCRNLVSRYLFSRRACKKEVEIEKAITEAGQFKVVSDRAVRQVTATLSIKDCFSFDSRKSILEDILQTLQDGSKNLIGVYGFGGMGKTTLAKQVASRASEEKMFEEIVMASVTQKADVKEIQGQLARMLGVYLTESSIAERAGHIQERLKGKKVLVILDDLWKVLDLKAVGVPFGEEHMSCTILLTSRYLHVISSMGTKKEFLLGALKEEEAWRLFEEKTMDVAKNHAFLTIGKKVAKRCAGLPVLIVTVAASLSRRPNLDAWNDALTQLRKMNNKQMHEIVNSAMESISYKYLKETHKRLFLLCGVIGGDASFNNLLKYILGLDLFGDEVVTVEEARTRLHALILDLKESCLLLDGYKRNRIKMHDVVRDAAISIARKDLNMFSAEGNDDELKRWPKADVLQRYTAMVIRGCPNLTCLPERLGCPSLDLFILSGYSGDSSQTIPSTFFEKTSKLKVLDMSGLHFSAPPSSLSLLKNLQTLRLDSCYKLEDISTVAELKKLQILSFAHSNIEELPNGIGQLSDLRLLDLSHCSKLKVIPAGLIASLSQLEELYMTRSFDRWEAQECKSNSMKDNASLPELKCLPNLSSLEIKVPNAKLLSEDLNFEKWKRYEIFVGGMWGWSFWNWLDELEITRKICLHLGTTSINHLQHGVKRLFKRTECLCLGELKGIKDVIPELDEDGFPDLKHLRIRKDCEIQYIVNMEDKQHNVAFPMLESLHLSHLRKLQTICNGRLMEESFSNLTIVKVKNCNGLESLFSFSMAIGLRCLQEIHVSNCDVLNGIVAEMDRDDDDNANTNDGVLENVELAHLRRLSLQCLPKLMIFFSTGKMLPILKKRLKLLTTDVGSEEIIAEEDEMESSMPFLSLVSFPKLEELELSEIFNLTGIWSHKLPEMAYCNLTRLTIRKCDNLNYLLTPSTVSGLVGLQYLIIQSCASMKHVVAKEEGEAKIETITFPQLSYLSLQNLPNLSGFYSGVEEMNSYESLDTAVPLLFNEKVKFPNLKTLVIINLESIKTIWPNQLQEQDSFCKLEQVTVENSASFMKIFPSSLSRSTQSLKKDSHEILIFENLRQVYVCKCESLKQVFPASVAQSLNQLEKLSIENSGVETIVGDDEDGELEEIKVQKVATTFTFPKLVRLNLRGLSKLKFFYTREHTTEWPALEELKVCDCDEIKIFPSQLQQLPGGTLSQPPIFPLFSIGKVVLPLIKRFKNLTQMEIDSCASLNYLFTPSITKELEKIQKITIRKCSVMKTVVGTGGEATLDSLIFPQLSYLCLEDLPNLTSFYSRVEEIDSNENVVDTAIQPLFNEKVKFPSLERLAISRLDSINTIWRNELHEVDSFCKLKDVVVRSCASLLNLSSSTMSRRTHILKERHGNLTLENLRELTVDKCESLKHVFPASVVRSLNKLEELCIEDCGVETLIGCENEKEEQVTTTFLFPIMARLYLRRLPKVECFYPKEHNIEWPSLKELDVSDCDKVSHLDFLNFPEKQGDDQFEKLISNLEFLSLQRKDIAKILRLYGHFPPHLFHNLKRLGITDFHDESGAFPSNFLHGFHNLEELNIHNCFFQEIFQWEIEEPIAHLSRLRNLNLKKLPEIKYICKQESTLIPILEKLVSLYVWECPLLTNLVPSSVSFRLLTDLDIQNCGGIKKLIPMSTARSLEQLKWLTIKRCQMIEEIISGEDEDNESEDGEIIFSRMTLLELEELPRLSNFCSRSCTLEFPLLHSAIVRECPNMKTFCGGIATTPKLKRVYLTKSWTEKRWDGDLNTTIQQIFAEMEAQSLTTTLPSTSENNNLETEAQIHENSAAGLANEPAKDSEIHQNATEPSKGTEICEAVVEGNKELDICVEPSKPVNVVDTPEKSEEKEFDLSGEAKGHFEKSQEPPQNSDPFHRNTAQERTVAGSGTSQQDVVSSNQLSPQISNSRELSPLATEVANCVASSSLQQKDSQGSHANTIQQVISLLSEFFQILQTQPLNSMNAEQVQFMEDAFRDLSTMNFSIEWFCPHVQKARECLERKRVISEIELKIAETEAQLQALKANKKALEDENEAVAL